VTATNPLAHALGIGQFCYVVELVASALKREAQVLEIGAKLAMVPEIVGGSVTSYAGGRFGQDPVRVATAVRARGLTPNVHLTCVYDDRAKVRKTLNELNALQLFNVFALTGDYPTEAQAKPVFDLDSVQLITLIAELREQQGIPFHISGAVSPFKYKREDCLYQYLKLEKKVAAGANLAITQVGWDARKFAELKRYLGERAIDVPVLGNVYVLGRRAAERMAGGSPPGCWASPELVEKIRKESEGPDGGLEARLERAAQTVAVLKGLGYAGAYIGGTHDAEQLVRIITRARELEPDWQTCAAELQFGQAGGFYLYDSPAPARRRLPLVSRALDSAGKLMPVTRDTWLRRRLHSLSAWVDRRPQLAKMTERFEYAIKRPAFGCQACGNCVLGHMEYVCPQTCPKQMRNGPCGGTFLTRCEVIDQECIWVSVFQRAEAAQRVAELKTYIPAPDRSLQGTSSWINYFLGRDRRPAGDFPATLVRSVRLQPDQNLSSVNGGKKP
jgi:methylenetetrahydrofolate reductase (NADPH)